MLHLKDGEHHFESEMSAVGGEAENYPHPIQIGARVNRSGATLGCDVEIETTAHFTCDRCVEPFEQPLKESFHQMLQVGEDLIGTNEEDVINVPNETVEFDFSDRIFEQLLLSRPMKLVCKDDCRGLCAECGSNLNSQPEECGCGEVKIDPRWEKLKELLK
ncbi:MAG: YceD family protein [Calditrichia bacterium]